MFCFDSKPVGEILLDEKLSFHIAFGRSDFGGRVGPQDFSAPDKVVHIDRIYIPEMQPLIIVKSLVCEMASGEEKEIMKDGQYRIF